MKPPKRPRPVGASDRRAPPAPGRKPPRDGPAPSPFAARPFTVEGLAAVREYLRFRPRALTEVHADKRLVPDVERLLATHGVKLPVLERRTGAERDASPVTAVVSLAALPPADLELRIAGRERDLIVALDHITDPRNLGAIVRSAAFFGVREILVPERRQVLLTQAGVSTAQGGFALADLVCVVNLGRALTALKDHGYWIVGTAMDGEPLARLVGQYDKVVLVLGAEDTGLSKSVAALCDRSVAIAGRGGLESLNVSVAAGIALNALALGTS